MKHGSNAKNRFITIHYYYFYLFHPVVRSGGEAFDQLNTWIRMHAWLLVGAVLDMHAWTYIPAPVPHPPPCKFAVDQSRNRAYPRSSHRHFTIDYCSHLSSNKICFGDLDLKKTPPNLLCTYLRGPSESSLKDAGISSNQIEVLPRLSLRSGCTNLNSRASPLLFLLRALLLLAASTLTTWTRRCMYEVEFLLKPSPPYRTSRWQSTVHTHWTVLGWVRVSSCGWTFWPNNTRSSGCAVGYCIYLGMHAIEELGEQRSLINPLLASLTAWMWMLLCRKTRRCSWCNRSLHS
jgi:hypothetical protein